MSLRQTGIVQQTLYFSQRMINIRSLARNWREPIYQKNRLFVSIFQKRSAESDLFRSQALRETITLSEKPTKACLENLFSCFHTRLIHSKRFHLKCKQADSSLTFTGESSRLDYVSTLSLFVDLSRY